MRKDEENAIKRWAFSFFFLLPAGKPTFSSRGSRSETEFIGFAGTQARTLPVLGLAFRFVPPRGSRPETEFSGFA
ncbi:MAG: hypothetical protein JNG50_00130, partial [Mogibacterium sp.]|uniref:hypothetical protein n=1 Tax=Mogibacterium sp. TaxID=2049035 RepID=UPI001A5AE3CB